MNPVIKTLAQALDLQTAEVKRIAIQVDFAFRKHESKSFKSQGAASGGKWSKLSPAYAKWKKRAFPGRKILSLTGGLRKSLTSKGPQHVAFGTTKPRASITVGTKNRLAAYHGPGRFHNSKLPVRDALQHRPSDEQRYLDIAIDYFKEVKIPRIERLLARFKVAQAL